MSDYGLSIHNSDGSEYTRFDSTVVSVYAFVAGASGSVYVPDAYAHATVLVSPTVASGQGHYPCTVSIASGDIVYFYYYGVQSLITLVFNR